jgi:hypothetical protein
LTKVRPDPQPQPGRKFTVGRLFLVFFCLLLAYCGQREARFVLERKVAREICEDAGGGGLRSAGPTVASGYLNPRLGEYQGSAQLLLVDGFEFIEIENSKLHKARTGAARSGEGYSRFSIAERPSPLCDGFDEYQRKYIERGKEVIVRREDEYLKGLGLAENHCIGQEVFFDPAQLKSEYEIRHIEEPDSRAPRNEWWRTQAVNRSTGEVVAEYARFGRCLDGMLNAEPLYNGCFGGNRNRVRCPAYQGPLGSGNPVVLFYDQAFVAASKSPAGQ